MTTALALPNIKELEQIKSLQVSIVSPETKTQAEEYLLKIDKATKQHVKDVKDLKAPHQAEIDKIDAASKPWKQILVERKDAITQALIAYNNKVRAAVAAANVKILDKYEGKVATTEAKAIAAGKPMPIVLPPQLLTTPAKTEQVDGGKITTVKRKAWRLAGGSLRVAADMTAAEAHAYGIPLEYFLLDTSRIGKIVRAGGTIPGIEVYEEESISVRAQ